MDNFIGIKHFTPNENWGDAGRINHRLLIELDDFREYLNIPIAITYGTQGKHTENSFHYKGLAVDLICPQWTGNILDLLLIADRFSFTGLGLYPDWHYEGKKVGGLHVDIRTGPPARWLKFDKSEYLALNYSNLKSHNVI